MGVASAPSQAGYYIFPDFAICKKKLAEKGITTGQQMCKEIFEKKKVAVKCHRNYLNWKVVNM